MKKQLLLRFSQSSTIFPREGENRKGGRRGGGSSAGEGARRPMSSSESHSCNDTMSYTSTGKKQSRSCGAFPLHSLVLFLDNSVPILSYCFGLFVTDRVSEERRGRTRSLTQNSTVVSLSLTRNKKNNKKKNHKNVFFFFVSLTDQSVICSHTNKQGGVVRG